jgi:hypothetical protein
MLQECSAPKKSARIAEGSGRSWRNCDLFVKSGFCESNLQAYLGKKRGNSPPP